MSKSRLRFGETVYLDDFVVGSNARQAIPVRIEKV